MLREQLLALCGAYIKKAPEPGGLDAARAIIEATPLEESMEDYVFNVHRRLSAAWTKDENAGLRQMLDEVELLAASFDASTEVPPPAPRPAPVSPLRIRDDVSVLSISEDRPQDFLWGQDPLVAVSADGVVGMTTNGRGNAMLWLMAGNVPRHLLEGQCADILACALTAKGEVAMTSHADGTVILWDAGLGVRFATLALDIAYTEAAFSADGNQIALLATDGQ